MRRRAEPLWTNEVASTGGSLTRWSVGASVLWDHENERLGEADFNRRARPQLNLVAGCRQHHGRACASADESPSASTFLAAEEPADESPSPGTDPHLLCIIGLGAFGFIRHRVGADRVAFVVDVEFVETKR